MRFLVSIGVSLLLVACNDDSTNDWENSSCVKSGAQCLMGGDEDQCTTKARDDLQDCNPDQNPGGAFCCAELAPADAGPN